MWGVGFLLVYRQEFKESPLDKETLDTDDSAIVMITHQPSDDESVEVDHTPVVDESSCPPIVGEAVLTPTVSAAHAMDTISTMDATSLTNNPILPLDSPIINHPLA